MTEEYLLSIAVITMNRSDQLVEAISSCLACKLPEKTQFVILDNASTDDTQERLKDLKDKISYEIECFYSEKNLGVGGGRSFVFEKAKGKYVYFLDDDAIIDPKCKDEFFIKSIGYLEKNTLVASLTTEIYDEIFGFNRTADASKNTVDGLPKKFAYLGGSHFLRKAYFSIPLYFNIIYGSEEYAPSIKAIDEGYSHVFDKSISIIHKPKVNKWVEGTDGMRNVQIRMAAVPYATKKILYPWIFYPILWLGYRKRCKKYLTEYSGAIKESKEIAKQIIKDNKCKKIRIRTVIKMYREFGLTVF